MIACGTCGANMVKTGSNSRDSAGMRRMVFRCRTGGGGHVSIDAPGLEKLLTEATLERMDTAGLATLIRQRGREGKQAVDLVAELDENDRRMDAATDSHNAGKLRSAPSSASQPTTSARRRRCRRSSGL